MDKESRGGPIVGGSSLLVIFAVLCLTVFALLGLSTVQAGQRLSALTAQSVTEYYRADTRAEEVFAALRAGEMPEDIAIETTVDGGKETYAYICPISDTQQLRVELCFDGGEWTVLRWQAESIVHWEADEDLNVWDGT